MTTGDRDSPLEKSSDDLVASVADPGLVGDRLCLPDFMIDTSAQAYAAC